MADSLIKYTIKDIYEQYKLDPITIIGKPVSLIGECLKIKQAKNGTIMFIDLADQSTKQTIQCIYDRFKIQKENWKDLWEKCKDGVFVKFIGILIKSPEKDKEIEFKILEYEFLEDIGTEP